MWRVATISAVERPWRTSAATRCCAGVSPWAARTIELTSCVVAGCSSTTTWSWPVPRRCDACTLIHLPLLVGRRATADSTGPSMSGAITRAAAAITGTGTSKSLGHSPAISSSQRSAGALIDTTERSGPSTTTPAPSGGDTSPRRTAATAMPRRMPSARIGAIRRTSAISSTSNPLRGCGTVQAQHAPALAARPQRDAELVAEPERCHHLTEPRAVDAVAPCRHVERRRRIGAARQGGELVDVVAAELVLDEQRRRLDERLLELAPVNSSVSGSTVAKNAASIVISDRSRRSASAWKAATSRPDVASRSSCATFHARDADRHGSQSVRPSSGGTTPSCRIMPSSSRRPQRSTILPSRTRKMLMPASVHTVSRRRMPEDLALVRARRREPLDDDVALGVEGMQVAVPVGERVADHRGHRPPAVDRPDARRTAGRGRRSRGRRARRARSRRLR